MPLFVGWRDIMPSSPSQGAQKAERLRNPPNKDVWKEKMNENEKESNIKISDFDF